MISRTSKLNQCWMSDDERAYAEAHPEKIESQKGIMQWRYETSVLQQAPMRTTRAGPTAGYVNGTSTSLCVR